MTTNEKNAAISRMIVDRVAAGEELSAAIDAVLGAGTHAAIVDDVYRALVARNVLEQVCENMDNDARIEYENLETMTVDDVADELTYLADYQG